MTKTKNNNIKSYSYTRAIACLGVVLLHLSVGAVSVYQASANLLQRTLTMCIYNNLMWAVPCFLMVSGALLLDKKKDIPLSKVFKKYILRMVIAIVACCILYWILESIVNGIPFTWNAFGTVLREIVSDGSWSHMWYLYLMVGIYLMIPIYKVVANHISNQLLRYLLLILVVFTSIAPILNLAQITSGFYIFTSAIYPFYFFIGHAFRQEIIKIGKGLAVLLLIAGTAGTTLSTVGVIGFGMQNLSMFHKYSSIFVVMQAVGLFALLKGTGKGRTTFAGKALLNLDKCSFGIYLIHMIFVRGAMKHLPINPYGSGGILRITGVYAGTLILSYTITWVLKKIPGVRAVV